MRKKIIYEMNIKLIFFSFTGSSALSFDFIFLLLMDTEI